MSNAEGETCALVVEDEEALRTLVKRILSAKGYRVIEVSGCEDALKVFEEQPNLVDVLFSDLRLYDGNGLELVRRLRKRRPGLPVVLSSGDGAFMDEMDREECVYLAKPFRMSQLLAAMESISPAACRI